MSEVAKTVEQLKAIPAPKIKEKVAKSLFGLGIMAAAGWIAWKLPTWPWPVPVAVFGVGCHVFSEEWTRAAVKFAVAVVRDVVSAVRGKNGSAAG